MEVHSGKKRGLGSSPGSGTWQPEGDTLSATHFDTVSLPVQRRLEAWREAIGVLFEVHPAEPEASEAPVTLDSWQLGPAILTTGAGPGFSYHRSPRAVARDGLDLFMVQFYEAGRCRIVRGAPSATSEPGDLVVTDLARPMATEETAFRNISLLLPRSVLAPLLRSTDTQGGRVLQRDLPLVALVRQHLEQLVLQAPRLRRCEAIEVLDVTVRLIAVALNGSAGEDTAGAVTAALACQVRSFIEGHLGDLELAPEALAARFGLSRATIYRMFVNDGGVRRYVQRRRLMRARIDLIRPAQRHRTVAQIGAAAGYARAQDFARAYRREFGVSPGEEREQARQAGRELLARGNPDLPTWAQWVRRIV